MTNATNPASMISVSSTQRTDMGSLPIDPMYAATACIMAAIIIPALVIGVKGWGEAKKLRQDQAKLATIQAATQAKIHGKR